MAKTPSSSSKLLVMMLFSFLALFIISHARVVFTGMFPFITCHMIVYTDNSYEILITALYILLFVSIYNR